ncbi:MAG: hypothetical protein E4H37_07805, partial [Gemmatimonadales bacterium]
MLRSNEDGEVVGMSGESARVTQAARFGRAGALRSVVGAGIGDTLTRVRGFRGGPMRSGVWVVLLVCGLLTTSLPVLAQVAPPRGVELADLTWQEAESVLTPDAVVVIALGAAAKEHGPHLRLDNDYHMAEYLKRRILESSDVVVAPTITYHFYPAFLEYPGSTHLRFETARDLVVDGVTSQAAYGPQGFYVLNTGVSTARPLAAAAEIMTERG